MNKDENFVTERLFALGDENYRNFHSKLVPNLDKEIIIGVRTPLLRKFAKELAKSPMKEDFLAALPHKYYEENNLHAFIVEEIKDYDICLEETKRFLPFVDNWATCDSFSPKVFAKNKARLLNEIVLWLNSEETYTIRFGIKMLMTHFLDDDFKPEYLTLAAGVKSDEYYVKMMVAWYFATALAKQYEATLPFIIEHRLDPWIHNRAIQKARESLRITPEQKEYLNSLKIKN